MATVPPHTHEFTIDTATTAEIIEGLDDSKVVTPAGIKPVFDALGGDMTSAVYDPNGVASDAFSMDSMAEGADTKILTAIERALLSNIAVTQPVDLDAMETKLAGIEASADVTDAGNVGAAIHGATAKSSLADNDEVAITDSEAGNVIKRGLISVFKSTFKNYFDGIYAAIAHSHTFASLTSKPTTLSGYGITDPNITQIAGLADPNADRLLFWDDSAGAFTHLQVGTNLSISGTTLNATGGGGGGGGDMYIATYDPTAKNSDAFLMSNMAEDTNAKIMTAAERAKIAFIAVTQAVDLDTMESDIAGKLTKASNLSDLANVATARTNLGLSADGASLVTAANYAAMKALLDLEIGTDIQAYDADLTSWAGVTRASGFDTFTATPSSANLRSLLTDETGTGGAVFATSPAIATPTLTDPVITGAIQEDIYTISDGAGFEIDPGNGTIQIITLGANRTPAATNFANGESVTLMIADGTAFTITWTTVAVTWVGGSAPTLATSGYTVVVLWKVGGTIYGSRVGDVA